MIVNNETIIIFVDVQQDVPVYLCINESGNFFLCTVEKKGRNFYRTEY